MAVRRASCGICARAVSTLLFLSAAACGGSSSSTPSTAEPTTPAPYVVASASDQSVTAGGSFSVAVAIPNAVAAGLGASTNVSVYPNATCSGAPAATQALAIDAGAGTATIAGLTVPAGSAAGTSLTWCASVPGPGGTPATATFDFTSYAAPSGTLLFTANGQGVLSQSAGAPFSLSISGVPTDAGWSSTLNGTARGNGVIAFPGVTANTVYTLLVTNPAGAQYATSATLTALPAFGAFTADRAALTVSAPATVTFAATFLPGGTGTGDGTVTASESVFGCPAACTTTLSIASGQPVSTTVTPGASAGTLTFTLSAGGVNSATQATIEVLAGASGATLVAADPTLTVGSSTTLTFGLGSGTAGTLTSDADPTLRVAVSPGGGPLTVSPTSTTIYTLTPVNGAGAAGTSVAATVTVVPRATLDVLPSATNVTWSDTVVLTVTDLNATASQTGSGTVTLWQGGNGDCVVGSIAGHAALSSGVATLFVYVGSPPSGAPLKFCVSIPNVTGTASTASTAVTVWSPPTITSFTPSLAQGGTVSFTGVFSAPGVVSGTILDDTGLQAVPTVNSGFVTSPVTNARSTTYTLVASNKAGRWTSTSVHVLAANPVLASVGTTTARFDATATRLLDGRVLLAGGAASEGGIALGTAALYDPLAETFTPTGAMVSKRRNHTAHLLSNGTVLLIGGFDDTGAPLASLEVFDPAGNGGAGTFSAVLTSGGTAGGLVTAHAAHTSTVLGDGQILVAGGCSTAVCSTGSVKAELVTVTGATSAMTSAAAGDLNAAHVNHTATLLGTGPTAKVLLAGGSTGLAGGGTDFAEVYDPVATFNAFSCVGSSCGSRTPMVTPRARHAAVLLGPGLVALLGGVDATPVALRSIETFDLSANSGRGGFTLDAAQLSTPRFALTAALLGGTGRLVAGGGFSTGTTGTTALDLYSLSGTTLTPVSSVDPLPAAMGGHGMVVDGTAALFLGAAPQAATLYSAQ